MKTITVLFLFLIILLIGPHIYIESKDDKQLKSKIAASLKRVDITRNQSTEQAGYVKVKGVKKHFTEKALQLFLKTEKRNHVNSLYSWHWQGVKNATNSAPGVDRLHHFANSYLVGFKPFETKFIWVPLYTLTLRKQYEYDHIQYSGLAEVWQNSRQAFLYTRGDCEDHAIILADWLIGLGFDARVVIGNFKGSGHAWVILFKKGKQYLLEATNKQKLRGLNNFILARMTSGYHPEYQFNRTFFWYNAGNPLTRDYAGIHWVLKSKFVNSQLRQ